MQTHNNPGGPLTTAATGLHCIVDGLWTTPSAALYIPRQPSRRAVDAAAWPILGGQFDVNEMGVRVLELQAEATITYWLDGFCADYDGVSIYLFANGAHGGPSVTAYRD